LQFNSSIKIPNDEKKETKYTKSQLKTSNQIEKINVSKYSHRVQ